MGIAITAGIIGFDTSKVRNVSGHAVTSAYAVGEKVYTRSSEEVSWFKMSERPKVRYNPANPDDSKL